MCMPSDNSQSLCFAKINKRESETKICCCCSNKLAALNNNFKKCLHKETKKQRNKTLNMKRLKIQSSSTFPNLKSKEKYLKLKNDFHSIFSYEWICTGLTCWSTLSNISNDAVQGSQTGGTQATCGPPDAFVWPALNSKSVKTGRFDQISPIMTTNLPNCGLQKLFLFNCVVSFF
jgi:hypothetical protein